VDKITTPDQRKAVDAYRTASSRKSELERTDLAKEKTGVFTGALAINPVNDEKIPIWVADYVMMGYGTGAIMAVPAHDKRDLEFAKKFKLPVRKVVEPPAAEPKAVVDNEPEGFTEGAAGAFTGDGTSVNSGILDGLPTPKAKKKITEWLAEKGLGKATVQYKLRDWLFSRQRYWGEPIPIVHCKKCGTVPVPENELPVKLPELKDYTPTANAEPPLAKATDWVNTKCPKCGGPALRETNTMPQWAGSCWYYLRYIDPKNDAAFVAKAKEKYWMPVDLYVGGAEHAVLHLLYSRFWHKVLFDLGHVSTPEPFMKLVNQGMILGENNQKMSKSRGNVINPDDVVADYGADAFRLYEMFMGPLQHTKPWSMQGVEGTYRFLGRVWKLFTDEKSFEDFEQASTTGDGAEAFKKIKISALIQDRAPTDEELRVLHKTIRKVTQDLDSMSFNTAISEMMIFVNEASKWESRPREVLAGFLKLLCPFAPHLAEELWQRLTGSQDLLGSAPWPAWDEKRLILTEIEYVVQVNGKVRDRALLPADMSQADLEKAALASEKIQKLLEGKTPKKVIVVPKRLVNIVV
jgi:leucyl-tRNA synthetase